MNGERTDLHETMEKGAKTPEYLLAPTLLPYLDAAWRNSQHYDGSRMALYRLYFIFAGLTFVLLAFAGSVSLAPLGLLGASLFVLLFGLLVQNVSVRYKERIVRDIRVIYRVNDLLLQEPEEMTSVWSVFHSYRKPQGTEERRIRARLSTTRLFLAIIAVVSTVLLAITLVETGLGSLATVAFAAGGSLLLHLVVYLLSKRGIAFNV